MIEFKIVNKDEYKYKAKLSDAYSSIIKALDKMDDSEALYLEADKNKITSIMGAVSHYFGNGVYGYKTIEGDNRIIYRKNNK